MSTTYSRLPTSESDTHLPAHEKEPLKQRSWKKYLLLCTAFLIIAVSSYKLGQRSGSTTQLDTTTPLSTQPTPIDVPSHTEPTLDSKPMTRGKRSVGYFVNWGIYGRKFPPSLIPVDDLTHILYAFAKVNTDGEIVLSDSWADTDIHYPGDSWNDPPGCLYGNFKALYNLKKQNRHLKVLLSIGGWTYSPQFHPVVIDHTKRAKFVQSGVRLLEDLGLDGLDVDYEYPSNDAQARGYVSLLAEMRAALDHHAIQKRADYRFLLTIAAPCGPSNYKLLHVAEMDKSLDFWNMMAYDFAGSWDSVSGHQANLYGGAINASQAIQHYINHGVDPEKIVVGIPLYGRSFMNTQGPGSPYHGLGPGSWEQGVYDYRALPPHGAHNFRDAQLGASWSYDYEKKEMISYDDETVGLWKGEWIRNMGLGGSMFWELSGDKGSKREGMEAGPGKEERPGQSLVKVVKEAMGGLEKSQNWLSYGGSKYSNIRDPA